MNFVFLFVDQQRAESLSPYGHPLVKTPNYDRLAAEGVRFEQCHTQCPLCAPARCSVLTGLHPHVAGHRSLWNNLKGHEPNLFAYLKQAGYEVVGMGKNDLFTPEAAALSMDVFKSSNGGNCGGNPFGFGDDRYYSFLADPFPGSVHETYDAKCYQYGIDFLKTRKRGGKPFMLYLPTGLPHPPYGAPQPFHDMYDPDDVPSLRPINDGEDVPTFRRRFRENHCLNRLPESFFRKINAIYLGMNSYVDWMLGNLLDALDASDVADDTVFILSSDHGDFAGDYGLVEKIHNEFYDVMTRVPLFIRAPGCKAGHVVTAPTETLDIMATVLDFAGVPARHTHSSHSLKAQVFGAEGDLDRAVFTEAGYNEDEGHCREGRGRFDDFIRDEKGAYYPQTMHLRKNPRDLCRSVGMRTLSHKLIRRPDDVSELFDLQKDPLETRNVYDESAYRDVRAALNERMLTWLIRTSDTIPHTQDCRSLEAAANN